MKYSGRCWKRRLVVLAIVASLPSGCGRTDSERPEVSACPPVADYGAAEQVQVAAELDTLPEGTILAEVLSD